MSGAAKNDDLKVSKLFDASNYTAIMTGGGSGIGLMITLALVSNGAKVHITGRRKGALQNVVDKYSTSPGKIVALPGDITSNDEIKRLASEVERQESTGVHLLVNNTGIARDDKTKYSNGQPDMKPAQSISEHLWKSDSSDWAATFDTNITAQFSWLQDPSRS